MREPSVLQAKLLGLQICVPKDYTDEQAVRVGESRWPCCTSTGWHVDERQGRVVCSKDADMVHVVLVA